MNINRRIQVLQRLEESPCLVSELGLTALEAEELRPLICRGQTQSGVYLGLTPQGRRYLAVRAQEVG
jgi:hypothetical protein